jgi:hypothetical protein
VTTKYEWVFTNTGHANGPTTNQAPLAIPMTPDVLRLRRRRVTVALTGAKKVRAAMQPSAPGISPSTTWLSSQCQEAAPSALNPNVGPTNGTIPPHAETMRAMKPIMPKLIDEDRTAVRASPLVCRWSPYPPPPVV